MENKVQQIECPVCQSPIYFSVYRLLQGESFTCTNCKSSISLTLSSKHTVQSAMKKYEELKVQNASKQ